MLLNGSTELMPIGDQRIGVEDKKNNCVACRNVTVYLNVVVQLLRETFPVCGVTDELSLNYTTQGS